MPIKVWVDPEIMYSADLNAAFGYKANIASPTFTGTVRSDLLKVSGMLESNSDGWSGIAFFKSDGTSYKAQIVCEPTTGMQIDYNGLSTGTPLIFRSAFVEQAAFASDGKLTFGSARDTNLYRDSANLLATDDRFYAKAGVLSQTAGGGAYGLYHQSDGAGTTIYSNITGEANPRFNISAIGGINWGAGGATAVDTNLYRSGADTLRTDDSMQVGGGLTITGNVLAATDNSSKLLFGSLGDTNLYRAGANILRTDDALQVVTGLEVTGNIAVAEDNTSKLLFGSAFDTNLYRSAADTLKTDDTLLVAGAGGVQVTAGMVVGSNNTGQMYFGSALDTNLYRSTADTLKTDDNFIVDANLSVATNNISKMLFGSAGDTNLYRSAANVLKTDDTFNAVGGVQINGTSVLARSTHTGTQLSSTISDFDSAAAGSLGIAAGKSTFTFTNVAAVTTGVISFGRTFASAPVVMTTVAVGTGNMDVLFNIDTSTLTTTGFQGRLFNRSVSLVTGTVTLHWFAIPAGTP